MLDSFWICEHCEWEYDGITEEDEPSDANGNLTVCEDCEKFHIQAIYKN